MSAEQPAVGEWFACLHVDSTGSAFEALWRGNLLRDVGTKEEAAGAARQWGAKVVRILPDGAHEAAVAKAREESCLSGLAEARSIVKAHKRTMTPRTPSDSALGAVLVALRDAAKKGSVK